MRESKFPSLGFTDFLEIYPFVVLALILSMLGCSSNTPDLTGNEKNQSPSVETVSQQVSQSPPSSEDHQIEEIDYELMSVEDLSALAPDLIGDSKWDLAKKVVSLLLENDTEPLLYHHWSGKIFFELGQYPEAMDEFSYVSSSGLPQSTSFYDEIESYRKKGGLIASGLLTRLHQMQGIDGIADQLFPALKLKPDLTSEEFEGYASANVKARSLTNYIVLAITDLRERLRANKNFWLYYKSAFFNKKMKWYADSREAIDTALSLADTQYHIFFALQFQESLDQEAPKDRSSDLDKIAALDLNENMLDEFLQKYSKDLSEKQVQKAREVMKMGMKLKSRLEKAENDKDRLRVLQDFKDLSEEILAKEEFPPDIRIKVEKGRAGALRRFEQLKEQIRIKAEALGEI